MKWDTAIFVLKSKTYDTAQGKQSHRDRVKITLLEEINTLEGFFGWDTLFLGPFDESIDIFHTCEVGDWFLDLLDCTWFDSIRQSKNV